MKMYKDKDLVYDVKMFLTFTVVIKYFKGLIVNDGDGLREIFYPPN